MGWIDGTDRWDAYMGTYVCRPNSDSVTGVWTKLVFGSLPASPVQDELPTTKRINVWESREFVAGLLVRASHQQSASFQ